MKRKTGFYVSIIILFAVIVFLMLYFNRLNRKEVKNGFESITKAEGVTIKELLRLVGYHLTEMGDIQLFNFFDALYKNESIIYLGIIKDGELIFLRSRYENYFPITNNKTSYRFFISPVSRIFEINSEFIDSQNKKYKFYIGFNYEFLTTFEFASKKNFLMIIAVILLVLSFLIVFIIVYDKKIYKKHLAYMQEKEDKEHFKELSLLTSEIAHEIKNPLNSLYLSFSALEDYLILDNDDAVFYKNAIKNEVRRISNIINSYSSLSRSSIMNYEKIDFNAFLNEFYSVKKKELEETGVVLKINNSINSFVSDKKALTQILLNMINNAQEAKAKNIELEFNKIENSIEIFIRDDGDEIAKSMRNKIFKPYISSKTKGMGLGLHITLKLIRALKGNIELLSAEKGNKIFKIIIKENKNEQ